MIKKALSIQTQTRRQSVLQPQIIGIIEEETSSVNSSSQALNSDGSVSFDTSHDSNAPGSPKAETMLIEEEAPAPKKSMPEKPPEKSPISLKGLLR